jgi:hypothetical protein
LKILPTPWDSKVLGMASEELLVTHSSDLPALSDYINSSKLENKFLTIKSEFWSFSLSQLLFENGYVQVEQAFTFQISLMKNMLDGFQLPSGVTWGPGQPSDLQYIFDQVERGLFSTDRYSLYPRFGKSVGGLRYVNWLKQELLAGGQINCISNSDGIIAFFSFREVDGKPFVALSGVMQESRVPGGGLLLHKAIADAADRMGATSITSSVSGNNLPVLRLLTSLGYRLTGTSWIFLPKSL